MKRLKITVTNIGELPEAATKIIKISEDCKIFLIEGEMGAGKTTLVKEICRQLGSNDNFSSPTFSIVNEYTVAKQSSKIYHIDLYRIKNLEEAVDLGIEEYLTGDNYCFIEWPELIKDFLPDKIVRVEIKNEKNIREIVTFIN